MFLSESLVLFIQFVFCITYVLEIRYAYTKDKQNEFTSYNIRKESLSNDGLKPHQYRQSEKSPLILTH
jgi:hypothetical protein